MSWELDIILSSLCGEETFSLVAVTLAFAILFVGILYRDFFVHEVLPIHAFDGLVGGFKGVVGDEAVAFGGTRLVPGDLCGESGLVGCCDEGVCVLVPLVQRLIPQKC